MIAEKLSNFIDLTLLRKHIRSDTLLVIIDFDEKFYNSNHIYFNKFTKPKYSPRAKFIPLLNAS